MTARNVGASKNGHSYHEENGILRNPTFYGVYKAPIGMYDQLFLSEAMSIFS